MALSDSSQIPFNILDVLQGPPNQPVYYRIEVGSSIKYLTASKPLSGLPDINGDYLKFDTIPSGHWDVASLVSDVDGKFIVASTEKKRFPDATPMWHASNIDWLELWRLQLQELKEGHDSNSQDDDHLQLRGHFPSAIFPGPKSLGGSKVAAFWNLNLNGEHNHGLLCESYIYSLIQDISVAPKFLAHLTDNHKHIIGYVLELVPARNANVHDLHLCKEALQKLHNLGIAHGHLTADTFLVHRETLSVQLQSFFSSYKTTDQDILDKEMSSVENILQQAPLPMRVRDEKLIQEITAIQQRDGYIHPGLFKQLESDGRIDISKDDHRAMLADLKKKNWQWNTQEV